MNIIENENKIIKKDFLLSKIEIKTGINGYYLDIELQNSTEKIDAKFWNISKEQYLIFKEYISKIVNISAKKQIYRGKPQYNISNMSISNEKDISKFIKKSKFSRNSLENKIYYYISKINNKTLKYIVEKLIDKYKDKFFTYPAASKIHHNFMCGLVQHTVYMLKIAQTLSDIYNNINLSYLYSGIILHDLGKVIEFDGVLGTNYTLEGKLIGHINIIIGEIDIICSKSQDKDLNLEDLTILKHLILSHHGKYEYGSSKLPMIFEAEILHLIDNLDAKIEILNKHLEKIEEGEFTEKILALESRSFYKPRNAHIVKNEEEKIE